MTIHYLDGGPFETTSIAGRVVFVVAYDTARNMFLAAPLDGNPFWNSRVAFDPQPPIPAAARKPQVGEVWIMQTALSKKHVARLVIRASSTGYDALTPDMDFERTKPPG